MLRFLWWKLESIQRQYRIEVLATVVALTLIMTVFFAAYQSMSQKWPHLPKDMIPSLSFLLTGFLFVVGTIYGRARDRREARRNRAIGLVVEWHSPDVRASRMFVSHYRAKIIRGQGGALPALSQVEEYAFDERHKLGEREISERPELERWSLVELHFFRIYQFFERWSLYMRGRDIDRSDSRFYLSSYGDWYIDEFIIPWFKKEDELISSSEGKKGDAYIRQSLGRIIHELRGYAALRSILRADSNYNSWFF